MSRPAEHTTAMAQTAFASVMMLAMACAPQRNAPPEEPAHDDNQEGFMHASGKSLPFLCRDEQTGDTSTCPTDGQRPSSPRLSCDASGCHGSYDFTPDFPQEDRTLDGSAGPGCYECHGQEWNAKVEAG